MPFLALAGPIAGALGASAGAAGLIGAGGAVAGSLIANNQANKALGGAMRNSQVDIDALDAKTRDIARRNALESAELERQLTPEIPALRTAANRGVLSGLGSSQSESAAESYLMGGMNKQVAGPLNTPLLQAAIAKAKSDLELGGSLPQDVSNLVTRRALANSGSVSGGLGLGRDLSARDLGLTSLDLSNRRLANAAELGGQERMLGEANTNISFNNASHTLNLIQLLQALNQGRFGRNLAAAQFGESVHQPLVGLDPGSLADVSIGNANNRGAALSNQANIYGRQSQNLTNFGGQLYGGLMGYNALGGNKSGVGSPTTYENFLKNNPYSSAALGQ